MASIRVAGISRAHGAAGKRTSQLASANRRTASCSLRTLGSQLVPRFTRDSLLHGGGSLPLPTHPLVRFPAQPRQEAKISLRAERYFCFCVGLLGIEPSLYPPEADKLTRTQFFFLVGPLGIEPSLYAPEAHVLPVYYGPTKKKKRKYKYICARLPASGGYYRYTTARCCYSL